MKHDIYIKVRAKVLSLAAQCDTPNAQIKDDEIIPETGILDSSAIIELIVWLEREFKLIIDDDEATIENLGSVNLIVNYVFNRTKQRA